MMTPALAEAIPAEALMTETYMMPLSRPKVAAEMRKDHQVHFR